MSWSSTQWLACSEDRSMAASTGLSFPTACHPPPPKSVFQILPLRGGDHLSAQPRTPVSALAPAFAPLSPRHPRLFPVCVCAWAPVPSLYSGNLWEGLVGRSDPGVIWSPSLTPSFLGLPVLGSSPFAGLFLFACRLPPPLTSDCYPPGSTHRALSRLSNRSTVRRAVAVTSLTLGKLPNGGVPQFPHLYPGDSCLGLLEVDAAA